MAVTHSRRMTADEFLSLPPDKSRTQLIDGELVAMTDVRLRHSRIEIYLILAFSHWIDGHPGAGEVGKGCNWRMDEVNVFIPDVWFLAGPPRTDRLWFDGPPDLVMEVRSASTWRCDVGPKKDLYLAGGAEVWLIDTEADVVLVFRGDQTFQLGRGDTLTTPLLRGLGIDVATLFDR